MKPCSYNTSQLPNLFWWKTPYRPHWVVSLATFCEGLLLVVFHFWPAKIIFSVTWYTLSRFIKFTYTFLGKYVRQRSIWVVYLIQNLFLMPIHIHFSSKSMKWLLQIIISRTAVSYGHRNCKIILDIECAPKKIYKSYCRNREIEL